MTLAEMLIDPAFIERRRIIFARWMIREGYSTICASEESHRIKNCKTMIEYLRIQRTGSKFPLDRNTKISLWLLFDNAGNHASIEFENA